jgi:hypothetical protein
MNRLSLAATGWVAQQPTGTGWVADHPIGNRLRWSWPEDAAEGEHRILPERILVERAPVDIDVDVGAGIVLGPAAWVPLNLWQHHGDVGLSGLTPVELSLSQLAGGPVQAVRFIYEAWFGSTQALVQAFDVERCVVTRWVQDGELVVLQAPAIDRLTVMRPACVLRQLSTLDLYAPSKLSFDVIAEINLAATGAVAFSAVEPRYPAKPTLYLTRWTELQDAWNAAWAEAPGAVGPNGGPNAWHALQIALAARWEHAVFCGLGFVDGPDNSAPVVDTWHDLLTAPQGVAYRIRDSGEKLAPSNVVYVPGAQASDLVMLPAPAIEQGAVRLGSSGKIHVSWDIAWTGPNPGTIGVEIEETLTIGSNTSTETYGGRGRRELDPPGAGFVHREEEVASHLVAVSARVRPQDGFDRLGLWGPWTSPIVLAIDHHPQPPLLRSATNNGTTTILTQSPPADWVPDALVAAANGTVRISRRIAEPTRLSASVIRAIPSSDFLLVKLGGVTPSDPAAYVGGQIRIGTLSGTVTLVSWPWATVDVPHGDGPTAAVPAGATAELSQSPTHPALFVQVHQQPAKGLPAVVTFPDAMPVATSAQLLEYRAQLVFAGQVGPLGPAVQALRLPATPKVPPPFKVTTLGVDFYHRTVVQLELTKPTPDLLEVWWADGNVSVADFSSRAVPGDAGVRHAEIGTILFDTLSLPVPKKVPRTVTIGVQAVNGADGRSAFLTVVHALPAAP